MSIGSQVDRTPEPEIAGTAPEPFDSGRFRRAFRRHPAGVVVITVDAGRGPAGFTATSLTSLSAEPALVSFGISATSSSWPHVRDASTAVVHFLAAEHEEVARTFATSGIDRFAEPTRWRRLATGEPLLDGIDGWLRVTLQHRLPTGDSHLVIARVDEASLAESSPLLYHDGAYRTL